MNHKITLAQTLAEDITENISNEAFAECLAEILVENLPNHIELTDDEWNNLLKHLTDFVEEDLAEDAINIVHEWNENTQELEEERKNIR